MAAVEQTLEAPFDAPIDESAAVGVLTDPADFYEAIYADAAGDAQRIPWCDGAPDPALVSWLNAVAPRAVRCGARVGVVGCGLGEDAREVIRRGYDVTAFDISRTAIEWARRLDLANSRNYQRADLFNPPPKWRHRFDLVVEAYTVQSLHPSMRSESLRAISDLLGPHGALLVISYGAEMPVDEADGPPWPLTLDELSVAAEEAGLIPQGEIDAFEDDGQPPTLRLRGLFRRSR